VVINGGSLGYLYIFIYYFILFLQQTWTFCKIKGGEEILISNSSIAFSDFPSILYLEIAGILQTIQQCNQLLWH
jgi:hypothetical protein